MVLDAAIVLVCVLTGAVLVYPKLARAPLWRAATTPLASIIGSGFLILGPILGASYGAHAPTVMAALCVGAYLFGAAIRFNISRQELHAQPSAAEALLEGVASWALAFAYFVSVAYYLNLFGSFAVSLTPFDHAFGAKLVTTAVFAAILVVGWTRGFGALERMEQVSVGLKLAIIAGLLFGLLWFFGERAAAGGLVVGPSELAGWPALALAFGLIVTVQGFETSRYLSSEYDAATRIRSMRLAQWLSAGIYMVYIGIFPWIFGPSRVELDETAIIDLMAVVAPILPALLIVAALGAQFSAAVADTGGSGGLLAELTHDRVSPRVTYALLVAVGLLLTWGLSVFEIISYASRAFAIYYAIQAAIAARGAMAEPRRPVLAAGFAALACLGIAIVVFGRAVE